MSSYIVVGGFGNMGLRYGAILRSLGHDVIVDDLELCEDATDKHIAGIIIATPTDTHYKLILEYHKKYPMVPILCEKPISKNMEEVEFLINIPDLNLTMVNQYANASTLLLPTIKNRMSMWDFVHSGKDGLWWDCINIIGLHDDESVPVVLRNKSPNWTCVINGKVLTLDDIDTGYYEMIEDWIFQKPRNWNDMAYILKSHKRVIQYIEAGNDKDRNRNTVQKG